MVKLLRSLLVVTMLLSFTSVVSAYDMPLGNAGLGGGGMGKEDSVAFIYNTQYYNGLIQDMQGNNVVLDNGKHKVHENIAAVLVLNWVTKAKIFGAKYSVILLQPLVSTNIDGNPSLSGLTDIYVSPFSLGWTTPHVDSKFNIMFGLPTGSAGMTKNHVSVTIAGGFTFFLDQERKWQISVSPQFEIHSEKFMNPGHTEGVDFAAHYGVGYNFGLNTLGVIGYSQVQISDDLGASKLAPIRKDKAGDEYVTAVGLQYTRAIPVIGSALTVYLYRELAAAGRGLGTRVHIAFAKNF